MGFHDTCVTIDAMFSVISNGTKRRTADWKRFYRMEERDRGDACDFGSIVWLFLDFWIFEILQFLFG